MIPQGTVCQLLSSLCCTKFCLSAIGYLSVSLTFPPFGILFQHVTMRRRGHRNAVAHNRSSMVCKSTSPWAAARSSAASVPDHLQSTMTSYSHSVSFVHQQKDGLEFGRKRYRFALTCNQCDQPFSRMIGASPPPGNRVPVPKFPITRLIRRDEKAGLRGMRYAPNVDVLKAQ